MSSPSRKRKVAKIKEKYELEELDDQLTHRYTVRGESLRDLANFVNTEITAKYLSDKPFSPEYVSHTLRNPDGTVSKRKQSELRRRLRRHDVEITTLENDWVTHMSVRSYLQKDLNLDTDRDVQTPLEPSVTLERVRGLVKRDEKIIWQSLKSTQGLDSAKWDLHTELYLIDKDTGQSVQVEAYLEGLDSNGEQTQ